MLLGSTPVSAMWTDRSDGDVGPLGDDGAGPRDEVLASWRALVGLPWSWLRQVHGARVALVAAPGGVAGETGDALVTASPGGCLAVFSADCALVALGSSEGVMGAAHTGWRSLLGGVLERTVEQMRDMGATRIEAGLGPCIHPECYEFSEADLAAFVGRFGSAARAETSEGSPALDVPTTIRTVLHRAGVELVFDAQTCTACSGSHFSHRANRDSARQALAVWR